MISLLLQFKRFEQRHNQAKGKSSSRGEHQQKDVRHLYGDEQKMYPDGLTVLNDHRPKDKDQNQYHYYSDCLHRLNPPIDIYPFLTKEPSWV